MSCKGKEIYRRGQLLYVKVGEGVGSEQCGPRFCVIIQNDIGNGKSNTLIVAFITSNCKKSKMPTHVVIPDGSCALPSKSVVMLEQIRTLDKKRIINTKGYLNRETMKKIDKAIMESLFNKRRKNKLERLPKDMRNYIFNKLEFIETCNISIGFLNNISRDTVSLRLAKEEKTKEENALKFYCHDNNLDYSEICKDFEYMKQSRKVDYMAI